ncbi:GNAT family N-acetyltransferase [Sphingomonas sp.]|jgi:ribosomal-protein-alanine N-acetyltransferase|uniref:GNAT family N-acetyltransferase n=1 Tax=Sphingomonas sp. TaxID=28214 RepID=UPI002EDA1E83
MATRTIELRQADGRDIDAVDRVMAAAFDPKFGEAWTRSQTLGVLAMPGIRLTLATIDGIPLGFAMVRAILDEAELLLIAVDPVRRRTGIGGALLRAVEADCTTRGVRKIHLEVRAGNAAVRLYTGRGFAQVGERRGYYRGNVGQSFDAHTYAKTLG